MNEVSPFMIDVVWETSHKCVRNIPQMCEKINDLPCMKIFVVLFQPANQILASFLS